MNSFYAKELAREALKDEGIEAFEKMGVIIIPVESPEDIERMREANANWDFVKGRRIKK
mgnify:CR=1 FL=1